MESHPNSVADHDKQAIRNRERERRADLATTRGHVPPVKQNVGYSAVSKSHNVHKSQLV